MQINREVFIKLKEKLPKMAIKKAERLNATKYDG